MVEAIEREKANAVVHRAKKFVTPTEGEMKRLEQTSSKVRDLLQRTYSGASTTPEIRLGGSYAKGTWLRGSGDIDFYLLFPLSYPREKLEGEAISLAKEAVRGYRINMRFAEHPYVESFVEGTRVNIVPCYLASKGEWKSAADRSPFHAEYVRNHFDDSLRAETRVLKKFVKGLNLYGAEVKTQGLSGYVCEVLTLKFGSFLGVLKKFAELQEREVISVEDYDKDFAEAFESYVIILDPIDTTRNLGTAISTKNVATLMLKSRRFLSKPSIAYFQNRPARRKGTATNLDLLKATIVISFKNGQRSVDILWGELRKSINALVRLLEQSGFEVLRSKASSSETGASAFLFLLKENEISLLKRRVGPEIYRIGDVERFVEKNVPRSRLSWIGEDGRVNFLLAREREATDARKFLDSVLSDPKQRTSVGLSKQIQKELASSFRVQSGEAVFKKSKVAWLQEDLKSILTGEMEKN